MKATTATIEANGIDDGDSNGILYAQKYYKLSMYEVMTL